MCPPDPETDDRQQKPKEPEQSWENWESTVREIYGDAMQRLEQSPQQTDKERFYSREGLPISNIGTLPNEQPVLGTSVDSSGRAVVRIYKNRQDAEGGKPALEQVFDYASDGNTSTEKRTIKSKGSETKLETAYDFSKSELSFKIEENGKKQSITLDADSKPIEFKVKSGDRELEYQIKDGKLVGVKLNGEEVKGAQLAEFLKAGEASLDKLRKANGIPDPIAKVDSMSAAGDQLNKLFGEDTKPEDAIKAIASFGQLAAEAKVDPKTVERVREIALTQATKSAVDALDSPEALKDPEKVKALKESLKLISQQGSSDLQDAFGGKAAIEKMVQQLDKPETAEAAVKSAKLSLEDRHCERNLAAAEQLRESSVTPKELLSKNLLSPNLLDSLHKTSVVDFYIKQLDDAEKMFKPAEAQKAMKQLAAMEASSPEAKKALDDYAGPHFRRVDNAAGKVAYARLDAAGGPAAVLKGIQAESDPGKRVALWRAAGADLKEASEKGTLTKEQLTLAIEGKLGLHKDGSDWDYKKNNRYFAGDTYKADQKLFGDALSNSIRNGSAEAVAGSILDVMQRNLNKGYDKDVSNTDLGRTYLEAIRSGGMTKETFAKQFDALTELAKKGDETAIPILIGLSGGAGQKYNEEGKDSVAERASKAIVDIAESKDKKLSEALASGYETMSRERWVTDNDRMMQTLAQVLHRLPTSMWGLSHMIDRQAEAFASQPDSDAYKSAIKGLKTLGERSLWDDDNRGRNDEAIALMRNFNPLVADSVKALVPKVHKDAREFMLQRLTEIAGNDTLPLEQRKLAQQTFQAVEKHATADQRKAIADLKLGETQDFRPTPEKPIKPQTSEQLVDSIRPRTSTSISEEDMPRIKKLVEQIDSPNALERDNAAKQLAAYGPAIIPILAPLAKGADGEDLEKSNRARAIVRAAMDNQTTSIAEKIGDFLGAQPGKPLDQKKLEEAIKVVDTIAGDTHFRAARKMELEQLAKTVQADPEQSQRAQRGLDELKHLDEIRADLRIKLAGEKLQAGDKEGARKLLTEAAEINPGLVKSGSFTTSTSSFSRVYVGAGGQTDSVLTTTISKAGGNPSDFAPRPTSTLAKNAGQDNKLKIEDVIEQGKELLSSSSHYDGIVPASAEERNKRVAEIMRDTNPERKREVVGLALDQYKSAKNDYERTQAMDLLKTAVQNGNDYALEALRKLSTMDAAMRLSDAQDTLGSRLATPEQKAEAQKRRDGALLDLARHEYGEREGRNQEHVGSANGVMDYLAKGAAPGITKEQVEQARKEVRQEVQVREKRAAAVMQTILTTSSPAGRQAAMAELEKLAIDQIGKEFKVDYSTKFHAMKESDAVRHALGNIDDPKKVVDALLELKRMAEPLAHHETRAYFGVWKQFMQSGDALPEKQRGELWRALEVEQRTGDRGPLEALAADKDFKEGLKQVFGPRDQLSYKLGQLKTEDVLTALKDPEQLKPLLEKAAKEAKANQKIVDGLVNDYLLRTSLGKPAMDGLKKALPAEDKAFKLPDDKDLRAKLQSAVDLEHLPDTVSKHAKTLLSGGELSAEQAKELRTELNKTADERRRDSIAKLNQMSFDNLHTTYKFESVVKELEGLEQLQDVQRGIKSGSAKDVAAGLEKLRDYMTVDHNVSREMIGQLEKNLGKGSYTEGRVVYDKLIADLKSGDETKIANALRTLGDNFPDATAKFDEYRAARIVRTLGPSSKPEEYQRVSKQLASEIEASKSEGGQENKSAVDWAKWTKANESLSTITQAAASNDSAKAKAAMEDLVKQAKEGNPYARAAVAAVLVGDQENGQIGHWMRNHQHLNMDRPIYVPNFRSLPAETRADLVRNASEGMLELSKTEKLTTEETSAMAMTLAKLSDAKGDKKTIENLTTALTTAVEGKSTKETLNGIFEAIDSDVKGSKALAAIYLKGVQHPEFANHFKEFQKFAQNYDKDFPSDRVQASARILAGIAAGMADKNNAANPLQTVEKDGKKVSEEVDPISTRARKALEEAAQVKDARSTITEAILDVHEQGKTDKRFKDNNTMLATLGTIAADLDEGSKDLRQRSLDEIRTSVKSSANATGATVTTDSAEHRSAVEGFFKMTQHWKQADVDTVKATFTESMFAGIQAYADKMQPAHRTEIAAKLVENITAAKDAVSFDTRMNSIRALSAFGKYLNTDQVALLASFGGDSRYNLISQNVGKLLTELKIERGKAEAIQTTIANNRRDLDKELARLEIPADQQKRIKDTIAGTTDGAKILESLGYSDEQKQLFKARAADGLLNVLASAPYSLDGKLGPRELAFEAFKNMPWPLTTGEIENGKPKIIESNNSLPLRNALIKYFEGKPITSPEDLKLSDQINRIVDNARLPRPSALIVMKMGIEGGPIENRKEGDPESVLDITNRIVRNYTTDKRSGQDVLRDVVRNIEMINSLPGYRRAEIMGWTKLDEKAQGLMGREEPSPEDKTKMNWDGMSPSEQEAVRWQKAARIDASEVARQMAGNGLQHNILTKALLEQVPDEVYNRVQATRGEAWQTKHQIALWQSEKKKNLDEFVEKTEKGANFGNQIIGLFTLNNGRDADLNADQIRLANSFRSLRENIMKAEEKLGRIEQDKGGLELSQDVAKYTELLNKGERVDADRLAIQMWKQHGPMLSQLAPKLWEDLTISTDTSLQGASMLKRLKDRGQVQWDSVPGFTEGRKGFREALGLDAAFSTPALQTIEKHLLGGKPDLKNEEFKAALKEAIDFKMLPAKTAALAKQLYDGKEISSAEMQQLRQSLGRGLMQLDASESKLDTAALRTNMLQKLDADPVLLKFSTNSRKMGDDLNELSKMFTAASKGSVYEEAISLMKEKATRIQSALEGDPPISRQDLTDLADRIKLMEEARDKMKADPGHNQAALDEIEKHIKTYKGMHNLFNKYEGPGWPNPRYPEEAGRDEKTGQPINQNKQITDMLKRIQDGGLSASTFGNWWKENGVLIGVTIAACAATVAACATFGVSSPAAVGLWVAVVGLAAREVTNEALFQVNRNGYTGWGNYDNKGSKIGDWNRKAYDGKFKDVDDAMWHLLTDVAGPYALEIARDWAAFVLTAGIMNKVGGMGGKESVKALFRAAPPRNAAQLAYQSERVAMIEAKAGWSAIAKSYARQFMGNLGREMLINSGFTGVHLTAETSAHAGIKAAFGREAMEKMGEWGQFGLSFLLSTSLAMGQGALHGQFFKKGAFEPGAKFKFQLHDGVTEAQMVKYMGQQGLNVKQIAPGKWEVLPVGAKAGMNPIIMENEATRGSGRPPVEMHPEGHPPAKQARPVEENVKLNETSEWKQTEAGRKVLKEVGEFTEHFMKPNGEGLGKAYEQATKQEGLPADAKMHAVDAGPPFDLKAYTSEPSPVKRQQMLQDYMQRMSDVSKMDANGKTAYHAKAEVTIDGHVFDLVTGKPAVGTTPTPDAVRAFGEFRDSIAGKRLLQEQAIHAMEERLHLQHLAMDNAALSPSYVKFLRDTGAADADHLSGKVRRDGSETARNSLEKELILALRDQGWSREMLEHHFGRHHSTARQEVLNWLRGQEVIADAGVQKKLKGFEAQGVDRNALEGAVKLGRLGPEDLETMGALLKAKSISAKDINAHLATPETQKAFSQVLGDARSAKEGLATAEQRYKAANETLDHLQALTEKALTAVDKALDAPGKVRGDSSKVGEEFKVLREEVTKLRDDLAAGTATPEAIKAVAEKLSAVHKALNEPTVKAAIKDATNGLQKHLDSLTKQLQERGIDTAKADEVAKERSRDLAHVGDEVRALQQKLGLGKHSDLSDVEVAYRSHQREFDSLKPADQNAWSERESQFRDLLKLKQRQTQLQTDVLLLDCLQSTKSASQNLKKLGILQLDPPQVWKDAVTKNGKMNPDELQLMLNGADKKCPPMQMLKDIVENGNKLFGNHENAKSKLQDGRDINQHEIDAKKRALQNRLVELEVLRSKVADGSPNNTFTDKVDAVYDASTKTFTYKGETFPVSVVPDHPSQSSKQAGGSTAPPRYQVNSANELTSQAPQLKTALKIEVVGSNGKPVTIEIPAGSRMRISGPDTMTPGESVKPADLHKAGVVFMEPKVDPAKSYKDGAGNNVNVVKEYRVMPPNDLPEQHAHYANGYVKQMEVHVDATTGRVISRNYLGSDGKPITLKGADGKPVLMDGKTFAFDPMGKLAQPETDLGVVHQGKVYTDAKEIPGISTTRATELNAQLDFLRTQVRQFHADTHFHTRPNGWTEPRK